MKKNKEELPIDTKILLRGIEIPSRFFFAPINTGLAEKGDINKEFEDFYLDRSGHCIGINYIGNLSIGSDYITNSSTAYFTNDDRRWIKLTQGIKRRGSIPGIQIACRKSIREPNRGVVSQNIELYKTQVQEEVLCLKIEEIEHIIDLFIWSALNAHRLGFDVVQIHAAHGYFLSQLCSEELNHRTDKYCAKDLLALKKIISGIRRVNKDLILDIRISYLEGLVDYGREITSKKKLIEELVKTDIDILSFSNGIYDVDKHMIYPDKNMGHAPYLRDIINYSETYPDMIWNTAGNIWDLDLLNIEELPQNLSFSLGRSLIADPLFVEKSIKGIKSTINKCKNYGLCHYYTNHRSHVVCPVYDNKKE